MKIGIVVLDEGYDALFPAGSNAADRQAAREAVARNDVDGVVAAGQAMVQDRAVYGSPEDIVEQLRRYDGIVDWALLYPPNYGVEPERVHANERMLIAIAAAV